MVGKCEGFCKFEITVSFSFFVTGISLYLLHFITYIVMCSWWL